MALTAPSEALLMEYAWPGNVRELESVIKRVVIFGEEEIPKHIETHQAEAAATTGMGGGTSHAPFNPKQLPDSYFEQKTLKDVTDGILGQIECRAIELSLNQVGWNRKKAAKALGISYRCLLYKIQQYALRKDPAPVES
jgi:DNA-binding NtrC family response regulator